MKKHSWTWRKTWRIWQKPTRICLRCKALLRFPPAGPRGGRRYAYCAPDTKAFLLVDRLPECQGEGAPVVQQEELYDAAARAR